PAGKVTVALSGDRLRSGTTCVGALKLDATVDDPFGTATADATVKAERLSGVGDLGSAMVTVKGERSNFNVGVQVAGAATNATLAAKIEPTPDEIRVALQKLDARFQGIPIGLNAPANITVEGSTGKLQQRPLGL